MVAVLGVLLAALAVPVLVYINRSPVLIVTSSPVATIYGEERIRRRDILLSGTLFRPVKTVMVADGVGSDVLIIALTQAAEKPFCVLFPFFLAEAAQRYHGEFPEIPVVILSGLANTSRLPSADGILCIYRTDRETDLYRAGLFAGIIGEAWKKNAESAPVVEENNDKIRQNVVLLQDNSIQKNLQELFSKGIREQNAETDVLFVSSVPRMPDEESISCVVIACTTEYLENNPQVPVVLFSWLDPDLVSIAATVVFDDSPWALAVPAVKMATQKQPDGQIPSKPLIISTKFADNGVIKRLKKLTEKNYE